MIKKTILLIEDTEDIRFLMKEALERDGYNVVAVSTATTGLQKLRAIQPHSILLDLILPDGNGLSFIAEIKKQTDAPIILVTARSALIERIVGFESGADDYVVKPFQLEELLARVKAHVRRYTHIKTDTESAQKIKFGEWVMDPSRLQVFHLMGPSANLTSKEFHLLEVLVSRPRYVFSRELLLYKSRDGEPHVTDRAIDTQIARIRRKLGDYKGSGALIESVRGGGYSFSGKVEIISNNDFIYKN